MSDAIRIGIVGLNWGAEHLKAFASVDGAIVSAIADKRPERLAAAAATCPEAKTFESANELIDSGEVDAVVIATPTSQHERQAIRAFDAGLHVLCDSPVGANGRETSHIVTSAGLTGKIFAWSNPLRFDSRVEAARTLVESGEIGDALHATAVFHQSEWPHSADSWRLERDSGGGALLAAGAQTLDAVWYAMGCPEPAEAMGARFDGFSKRHASTSAIEHAAEDTLSGMVRFKNGATLHVVAQINHPGNPESVMRIWGVSGHADLVAGNVSRAGGVAKPLSAATTELAACLAAQARSFLAAVRGGEIVSTGKHALSLAKMTDALASSAKEREAVSIKVERTLDDLFGAL